MANYYFSSLYFAFSLWKHPQHPGYFYACFPTTVLVCTVFFPVCMSPFCQEACMIKCCLYFNFGFLEFLCWEALSLLSSNDVLGLFHEKQQLFLAHLSTVTWAQSAHGELLWSPNVRQPSCVVHNFFKHLLLLNHWVNLDETWQGCFLGEALPKLVKRLNSTHNSGCHGHQKEKNSKIF